MKTNKIRTISSILSIGLCIVAISYSACKKKTTETPPNPNEEELITTLQILLIDSAGVQPNAVVRYRDIDGDGGNAPTAWDTIRLKANTTYNASILLLDESKTSADTISHEVAEEAVDHLFCFTAMGVNCNIAPTDVDANGLPLGLNSKWKTDAVSAGSVQVVLRHQPGIKTGSCTPGASDVDVLFQCRVE